MADDDEFDMDAALDASMNAMEMADLAARPTAKPTSNVVITLSPNDPDMEIVYGDDKDNNTQTTQNDTHAGEAPSNIRVTSTSATAPTNPASDDAILDAALNMVNDSVNSANTAQKGDLLQDDEMKEFFSEIFTQFSNLDENADDSSLDAALKKVMTQFFDAEQLREPVQIICNKYPYWLEEHKTSISTAEFENYTKQSKLYEEANKLLLQDSPNTEEIMNLLLKTFEHGSLPAEVMDGMMPQELKQFADQMAQFEQTHANDNNNNDTNNDDQMNNDDDDIDENAKEAMDFFQHLMGMNNQGQTSTLDDHKTNAEYMPTFDDLPKLNDAEMKEVQRLMQEDGCLMM